MRVLIFTISTVVRILFHDRPFEAPLATAVWYLRRLSLRAHLISHILCIYSRGLAGSSETVRFAALRTQEDAKILF